MKFLAAFSLAMIALAYLVYQIARRAAPLEASKAILLAAAFLFWAANQFWPDSPQATLFNDIAIALFVLDVFLVIAGWPRASEDSSFAESWSAGCAECCAASCRKSCARFGCLAPYSEALRIHSCSGLSWYDSIIVGAAAQAHCDVLKSEDLQHGQSVGSVREVNPFL